MTLSLGLQIRVLVCQYEALHDKKPTKLLIGKAQLPWLQELTSERLKMGLPDAPGTRPQYRGLTIYRVDDESFLEVI